MKIAFVCTGNICRSPMAEAVMQYKAGKAGLGVEVGSFGTHAYHVGETADPRTLHVLNQRRIGEPSREPEARPCAGPVLRLPAGFRGRLRLDRRRGGLDHRGFAGWAAV